MSKKAVLAGASGLIGSYLLNILLKAPEYDEILILVRKKLSLTHNKLSQLVVDFDDLDKYAEAISGRVIFCCLGTTRKKSPDLANYRKVDQGYPLALAQLGRQNEVSQFHLVSTIGANAKASNFYTKMKGETENLITGVKFKTTHIYQPSVLTGARSENRPVEKILMPLMKIIDPLLVGSLRKYRSIPAKTVAMAMYKQSLQNEEGLFIHPSDKIKLLA